MTEVGSTGPAFAAPPPNPTPERLDAVTRRVVKQAAKAKRRRDPKQLELPFSERNDDG